MPMIGRLPRRTGGRAMLLPLPTWTVRGAVQLTGGSEKHARQWPTHDQPTGPGCENLRSTS
jgi:hypothetical protein